MMGGGGGGGGGLTTPPGGKPGDWMCPRCSNHNFAFRDNCQKCQMTKAEAAGGGGGGGGYAAPHAAAPGGYGGDAAGAWAGAGAGGYADPGATAGGAYGAQDYPPPQQQQQQQQDRGGRDGGGRGGGGGGWGQAPGGPPGLFAPGDWTCGSCMNTNWERRSKCNQCGAPKPGTGDQRREGQVGGDGQLEVVWWLYSSASPETQSCCASACTSCSRWLAQPACVTHTLVSMAQLGDVVTIGRVTEYMAQGAHMCS
jgi:RNA-binding protein FUS